MNLGAFSQLVLEDLYERCRSQFNLNGSFVISSLSSRKNTTQEVLRKAAVEINDVSSIQELINLNLVRRYRGIQYVITAKGAWYIESQKYGYNSDDLIDIIDRRYFLEERKSITSRNRIVLLALMSACSFSEKTELHYMDGAAENIFLELLINSQLFLHRLGTIEDDSSSDKSKTFSKKQISRMLGEIDKLKSTTFGIFESSPKRYHLNILENGTLNVEAASEIFEIIFTKIEFDQIDEIITFCNDQYLNLGFHFHNETDIDENLPNFIEESVHRAVGL